MSVALTEMPAKPRDYAYQQRALTMLFDWFAAGSQGNPCLVMPTGSGKSHVIADICQLALVNWPETRILMLTHVRELIEQNVSKLLRSFPDAPLGVYSAGLGRRETDAKIIYAGIQSVYNKSQDIGHIDIVIIDEAHRVGHTDTGGYRNLIARLRDINPHLRVIGLTATPYRLGHGLITDHPAIFHELIEPVTIQGLILEGYLSPLCSVPSQLRIDCSSAGVRAGEYIPADIEKQVNTAGQNAAVVSEVIALAEGRKSWLFFCVSVAHANDICRLLIAHGINAAVVTGKTPIAERDRILTDFVAGKIQALTNCEVLTTGFDAPIIDLIVLLRPTLSPGLYVQMVGRGLRIAPGKRDCAILDFVGCIDMHGPITAVKPPQKPVRPGAEADFGSDGSDGKEGNPQEKEEKAEGKRCPDCLALCELQAYECHQCGHQFEMSQNLLELELRHDDIMGDIHTVKTMRVTSWAWRPHRSKSTGNEMLAVTYYGALSDTPITEYFPVLHDGYAGAKARRAIRDMETAFCAAGSALSDEYSFTLGDDFTPDNLGHLSRCLTDLLAPPSSIEYRRDGRFYRIIRRKWG